MNWTIEIDYTTGSSFHTEDCTGEEVGYVWERKEDAIAALKDIEEHYELYKIRDDRAYRWHPEKKDEIEARRKELKKRPWCAKQYTDHSLLVIDNDGERRNIHVFWTGYFETLNEARVVSVDPDLNDMVFRPNPW